MEKGYIYIMYNTGMPDYVKIGYAKDVEAKRKNLSKKDVPCEYELYATYETSAELDDKRLHELVETLNPGLKAPDSRDFYQMTPEDAYRFLEAIAIISKTKRRLQKDDKKDKGAQADVKKKKGNPSKNRKPPLDPVLCGIPIGSTLVYTEDPSVTVETLKGKKVLYNGETTSLSAIVQKIKGVSAAQGTACFTHNGRLLTDIAEETQWADIGETNERM